MKALVYHSPGKPFWEDKPQPSLQDDSDAIVKVLKTTICGTDLHILKGDLASVKAGRILGHEGIGVVERTGSSVHAFKNGDKVLISCVTACGSCQYCRRQMYSHCETGGWILGNTIDGTQAEFVRIPHADNSLYPVPEGGDEEALLMFSDIFPTAFECGVLNGRVKPGSDVAIVGAGPIGLSALITAQLYSPGQLIMVDLDDSRLEQAKRFGATACINNKDGKAPETIRKWTEGRGVDTAIEAVGTPATFELCQELVAPGGTLANIGVHGKPATLHLEKLWDRNIAITTRLVDTSSLPMLLKLLRARRIDPKPLITHRFPLAQMLDAYETFSRAATTRALKVVLASA